jgi:N-acetylneuraminic acid mutarotase
MPVARAYFNAAALGGKIYAVGGNVMGGSALSSVSVYDPANGAWSAIADMPTNGGCTGVSALGSKLYVTGGELPGSGTNTNNAAAFDPATGKWTSVAGMSTPRSGHAFGAVGGKLIAAGGYGVDLDDQLKSAEMYDPGTDKWGALPDMSTVRFDTAAGVLGNKFYVVGGCDGSQTGVNYLQSAEVYDLSTGKWSAIADMSTPRAHLGVGVMGGMLYAVAGQTNGWAQWLESAEMFDPDVGSWKSIDSMSIARGQPGVAGLLGKLYVLGGGTANDMETLASAEVYTPPGNACTGSSRQLPAAECNAWVAFFDATGGPDWKITDPELATPQVPLGSPVCSGSRTDPCSCKGTLASSPVCNKPGTAVTTMWVTSAAPPRTRARAEPTAATPAPILLLHPCAVF